MNAFEKVLIFLQGEMSTPTNYGWYHLLALACTVALTVFLCVKLRNADDKTVRAILLAAWYAMVVLECYKQLVFAIEPDGDSAVWDYAWYAFPFQFCSSPIYTLPFAIWLKNGRVGDAFLAFLSTFSLFGGLAVMFYPNDVFVATIGINIQTMVHHGLQVVLGIFLAVHRRFRLTRSYFLGSIPVFAAMCTLATALNVSVYHGLRAAGQDDTFNMFFISPYFDCTLPVLSIFDELLPYPVFLLLYLLGFTVVAAIVFFVMRAIITLVRNKCCHASA